MLFAVIALCAVALSLGVDFLDRHEFDAVITLGLRAGEYSLFISDLLLFTVFNVRLAHQTYRKITS
jgi:hypothetical protein